MYLDDLSNLNVLQDHCAAVRGQLDEQAAVAEIPGCRIVEILHELPRWGIGSAGQRRSVNIEADIPHPGTRVGANCLATISAVYGYTSIFADKKDQSRRFI